jgi:hypothetical protein
MFVNADSVQGIKQLNKNKYAIKNSLSFLVKTSDPANEYARVNNSVGSTYGKRSTDFKESLNSVYTSYLAR